MNRVTGLRLLVAASICVAALLSVTVDARTASADLPRVEPERCRIVVPDTRTECGQLVTRLDRGDAANTALQRVSYIVLKARSATPKPDPVVFLTGGNGISAFFFLNVLARSPSLADRDMIVIELRGNGYSEPNLLCQVGDADTPAQAERAIADCHAQLLKRGAQLSAYNLAEAASDVDDLRKALKIPEWNVYGTSHGSFWGSRYLAMKPEGIRSIILDSPLPSQRSTGGGWTVHLNGLDRVFAACAADLPCNAAYPDLKARFIGLVESLDRQPVKIGKTNVTADTVFGIAHGANFETATLSMVPRLVDAMPKSDLSVIQQLQTLSPYGELKGFDPRKASSTGVNINDACINTNQSPMEPIALDRPWPERLVEAAKRTSFSKRPYCGRVWKVTPVSGITDPVVSDVQALVTVGLFDPETPREFGELMASTLVNSTLLVLPDSAHAALVLPSACTSRVIAAFLDNPKAPRDVSCLAGDRIRFILPDEPIATPKTGR